MTSHGAIVVASPKGGDRTDGERAFLLAEGGAEERVEMELPIDGDGTGDTDRVDGVVGTFLPFIDDEKEDCKRR